jgi:hypothetical protein
MQFFHSKSNNANNAKTQYPQFLFAKNMHPCSCHPRWKHHPEHQHDNTVSTCFRYMHGLTFGGLSRSVQANVILVNLVFSTLIHNRRFILLDVTRPLHGWPFRSASRKYPSASVKQSTHWPTPTSTYISSITGCRVITDHLTESRSHLHCHHVMPPC